MVAELLPEKINQPAPVLVFFFRHFGENLGGGGIGFGQTRRIFGVDAAVLLLQRDGKRQDFAFVQFGKAAHR